MQREDGGRTTTRWPFVAAACLFLLYALNVALGMLAVKSGMSTWRVGDVGEFLLVLSCMAFFVAGLVVGEERQASASRGNGGSNTTNGGVR
jgi:heme A synthase